MWGGPYKQGEGNSKPNSALGLGLTHRLAHLRRLLKVRLGDEQVDEGRVARRAARRRNHSQQLLGAVNLRVGG
jgi:hypothetical protein